MLFEAPSPHLLIQGSTHSTSGLGTPHPSPQVQSSPFTDIFFSHLLFIVCLLLLKPQLHKWQSLWLFYFSFSEGPDMVPASKIVVVQ